jgi:hypothetical protein
VASLRKIGVPLAQIKLILSLEAKAAAGQVGAYWAGAEADHAARRELARYLVDRLNGRESVMYEVAVGDIPARSLLSLQRHVTGEPGVVALGKEFVGLFRDRPVPRMEGATGAAFLVYYGEVSEDSDGPIEWCRPVPEDQAQEIAARFPELTLRKEPAHQEAYVHLGTAMVTAAHWQVVSEALHTWGAQQDRQPADLGVRVTFLATPPPDRRERAGLRFRCPTALTGRAVESEVRGRSRP